MKVMPWIAGVVMAVSGGVALAQDESWAVQIDDDGAYVYGLVQYADIPIYLYCLAPSPEGRPAEEVGAQDFRPMAPYTWRIEADRLLIPGDKTPRSDVALIVDGMTFDLPQLTFNPDQGLWGADLAMNDPVLGALLDSETLVLAVGLKPHWGLAMDGLAAGLDQTMTACIDAWAINGAGRPDGLAPLGGG